MTQKAGQCDGTSLRKVFILTPSLEELLTKAKEAFSVQEVKLTQLETDPVFLNLRDNC